MKTIFRVFRFIASPVFGNKRVALMVLKMLMHLDNLCYRYIATFSKVVEGGVHPKHRLTEYHKFFIDNIRPGDNVLDVGCGNGCLTYDIAQRAGKVTGIDLNRKNIAAAKAKFNHSNIHYMENYCLD